MRRDVANGTLVGGRPPRDSGTVRRALQNRALDHVHFDISWDECAKYLVADPGSIRLAADVINRHPDRCLFGTDEVAPAEQAKYLKVYTIYAPLLERLTPVARAKLLKGNYERLFDAARRRVRAWEKVNVDRRAPAAAPTPAPGYAQ